MRNPRFSFSLPDFGEGQGGVFLVIKQFIVKEGPTPALPEVGEGEEGAHRKLKEAVVRARPKRCRQTAAT
jgi:hypothetical protein